MGGFEVPEFFRCNYDEVISSRLLKSPYLTHVDVRIDDLVEKFGTPEQSDYKAEYLWSFSSDDDKIKGVFSISVLSMLSTVMGSETSKATLEIVYVDGVGFVTAAEKVMGFVGSHAYA